ncbi:Fur family transcriptional regulator [Desulfocurvibacter africanus]|uniref:Ferric uptake regulator, Fur family n=1 Tax=Desulfocurvibacter africanus subsp. africanus str. Walvis Bay TaxID=690850 RepID=F3YXI3_DESAF|nr:transcriptional repressor [Desulfocurvibacter africanus]EGJ51760.1 ferric uptake regulator, Fur family [Desulfocurvibacter africanus subsp. africanus str. Walvis Bay]
MDKNEIEERMHALLQACSDAGARLTPQRIEIFREVVESEEHPDAEMIYQRVRERLATVSLDTVYRTLWWLAGLGLVATVGPAKESTRFDANLTRHHHFVCVRCGLTRDFYSRDLDNLELPASVAAIGSIERTQVEVKGICHACAERQKSEVPASQGEPGQA